MSVLNRVQQWATFARVWHIYDAAWQNPFQSAELVKKYLMGLHKPIYHPMNDCGDHVIVINSNDIALPGDEWKKRVYFHHTGYPGGASWTLAWELHQKDPTMVKSIDLVYLQPLKTVTHLMKRSSDTAIVLKKAVYNSMDGNLQRRSTMERLHIFPDANVPTKLLANVSNQIAAPRMKPRRLDHYSEEEVKQFPKLIDLPKNYIPR